MGPIAFLGAKAVYDELTEPPKDRNAGPPAMDPYQVNQDAAAYGGHAGTVGHYEYVPNAMGIPMPQWVEGTPTGSETHARAMDRRGDAGYDAGNAAYGQAQETRGAQGRAMDMAFSRAAGNVPSQAQMMADRQGAQLVAQQQSQAASARGAAGLALAQQNAANATATGMAGISANAQQNAAAERERAERAAFEMASGMRTSDMATGRDRMGQGRDWAGLGHDIRKTGAQMGLETERLKSDAYSGLRSSRDKELQREHEHDEGRNKFQDRMIDKATDSKVIKPGSGDDGSDERMKRRIGPLSRAAGR